MKKFFYYFLILGIIAVMLPGCTKDDAEEEVVENTTDNTDDDTADGTDDSEDDEEEEEEVTGGVNNNTDGSGTYTFESEDEGDDDDILANSKFERWITVTYSSEGATIDGDNAGLVTVQGNYVTVNNTGSEKIVYELKGSASNGYFKLYSEKKQVIYLNGLDLTYKHGAAINNQSKKRTFVLVEGTNTLADGSSYSTTPEDEDEKAAFFSEAQLIFSGTGTLDVNAKGKAGITSDDYVRFMSSPTITVSSSAGHGVRGKEAIIVTNGTVNSSTSASMKKAFTSDSLVLFDGGVTTLKVTGAAAYDDEDAEYTGTAGIKADMLFRMNGGELNITNSGCGGKGISCDDKGEINGGTINITVTGSNYTEGDVSAKGVKIDGDLDITGGVMNISASAHEALECKGNMNISGGEIYAISSDDAINSAGDLTVTGGYVYAHSSGNDGMDANGDFYIKGGVVMATGTGGAELALDANTEGGAKLYIMGGTLITFGGLENGASLSQPIVTASWSKNTKYALYDGSTLLCAFTAPSAGNSGMIISHGNLKSGSSYTLKSGVTISGGTSYLEGAYVEGATVSGGNSTSLTATTTYSGGGPGGGGFPGGRW